MRKSPTHTFMNSLPLAAAVLAIALPAQATTFSEGINFAIGVGQGAGLATGTVTDVLFNVWRFLTAIASAIALIAIVWGGLTLILALGDENRQAKAKRVILYAVSGLIVVGIAYAVVGATINIVQGSPQAAIDLIDPLLVSIIQFMLALMAAIAFGVIVYGGYLYIVAGGDEAKVSRAKRVLVYAVIGMIVILASAIIVNAVVALL